MKIEDPRDEIQPDTLQRNLSHRYEHQYAALQQLNTKICYSGMAHNPKPQTCQNSAVKPYDARFDLSMDEKLGMNIDGVRPPRKAHSPDKKMLAGLRPPKYYLP